MKIEENNVKCGEIIIFDHKFYQSTKFPPNFVAMVRILSKKLVPGVGFPKEKFSRGMVIG